MLYIGKVGGLGVGFLCDGVEYVIGGYWDVFGI